MTDESPIFGTGYQPDVVRQQRQDANRAKARDPLTTDKPVQMRVARTRPNTQHKHYARKPRRNSVEQHDPRNVRFF